MADNSKTTIKAKVLPFAAGALVIAGIWAVSSYIGGNTFYTGVFAPQYDSLTGNYSGNYTASSEMSSGSKGVTGNVVGNITQDRKVTKNYLSIHVKSVITFHKDVTEYVLGVKGKVMNEDISESSDTQAEKGTLTVLVPNAEAPKFLAYLESKSIKVVDRSVTSYEITKEYTDIERQLTQYEKTYEKILSFYNKANTVSDLLSIQQQLDQVQSMIDSLKGRKMALAELSENTQYTVYSSTNEYDLPYVPDGTFQFGKTFKLAVRALVGFTDDVLSYLIYLAVFSPVFLVLGLLYWGVKKYVSRKA